jgi:hypothetical protein
MVFPFFIGLRKEKKAAITKKILQLNAIGAYQL